MLPLRPLGNTAEYFLVDKEMRKNDNCVLLDILCNDTAGWMSPIICEGSARIKQCSITLAVLCPLGMNRLHCFHSFVKYSHRYDKRLVVYEVIETALTLTSVVS